MVDEYVRCLVKSVAKALKLKLRLEQQSFINGKKADHWVIAFGQDDRQGWIVGCNENKLPKDNYEEPYVLLSVKISFNLHWLEFFVFNEEFLMCHL